MNNVIAIPAIIQIPPFEFPSERLLELESIVTRLENAAWHFEQLLQKETISWSEKEAAELLGISHLTLQRIRRSGLIGYTPVGGKARYLRSHIEDYLENNSRKPSPKRKR